MPVVRTLRQVPGFVGSPMMHCVTKDQHIFCCGSQRAHDQLEPMNSRDGQQFRTKHWIGNIKMLNWVRTASSVHQVILANQIIWTMLSQIWCLKSLLIHPCCSQCPILPSFGTEGNRVTWPMSRFMICWEQSVHLFCVLVLVWCMPQLVRCQKMFETKHVKHFHAVFEKYVSPALLWFSCQHDWSSRELMFHGDCMHLEEESLKDQPMSTLCPENTFTEIKTRHPCNLVSHCAAVCFKQHEDGEPARHHNFFIHNTITMIKWFSWSTSMKSWKQILLKKINSKENDWG